jgi:hypothetical protein
MKTKEEILAKITELELTVKYLDKRNYDNFIDCLRNNNCKAEFEIIPNLLCDSIKMKNKIEILKWVIE